MASAARLLLFGLGGDTGGGGGGGFVTWNPATAAAVTLSGGDLVATSTGTTVNEQGARTASAKTTGKYYFEVTATVLGSFSVAVCTLATTYTQLNISATGGTLMYGFNGAIWNNGVNSGNSLGGRSTGNVIGVAVDLDNRMCWFRVAPSGNWNGSGTANPATNTGGVGLLAGAVVPACAFNTATTSETANFGASAFSGAVPAGFTSGWPV